MRIVVKGGVWKNTEDEILKAAVMKYGKNQWARISSLLVRKTAKQCKARWYEWLDPSIKKTEWSRDEEERLLHLAKVMPNQWRTIAPIVGRTASQCLEHYEKLLDAAQSRGEELKPEEDPRRLRPGEIDPTPETKPARPDPVDMDEDEKEMLSEARARLANTKGKKAKRKAREKQLEEARRLAALQKRREMKAAGIDLPRMRRKLPKGQMDYNIEIPFERRPPPGFYAPEESPSTSTHWLKPNSTNNPRLSLDQLEKKRGREQDEERLRRDDAKRMRNRMDKDLPSAVMQINRLTDPLAISSSVRGKLCLPAPQLSDEDLSTLLQAEGDSGADLSGGTADSNEGGSASSQATKTLLESSYAVGAETPRLLTRTPTRTPIPPMRTPSRADTIRTEAENLLALSSAQTPLFGGSNAPLHPSDFSGVTPRPHDISTPNPMLRAATPSRGPANTPSRGSAASIHGGTPSVRDTLGLNETLAEAALEERGKQRTLRSLLRNGLRSLPAPQNEYRVQLPAETASLEESPNGPNGKGTEDLEGPLDQSDVLLTEQRHMREREQMRLRTRSQVLARREELPRPFVISKCFSEFQSKQSDPLLREAEEMLRKEIVELITHDSLECPFRECRIVTESSSMPFQEFQEQELLKARSLIEEEARNLSDRSGSSIDNEDYHYHYHHHSSSSSSTDYSKNKNSSPNDEPMSSKLAVGIGKDSLKSVEFSRLYDTVQNSFCFVPSQKRFVHTGQCSRKELIESLSNEFDLLKANMVRQATKAKRLETRIGTYNAGYEKRSKTLLEQISNLFNQITETSIELECFKHLKELESQAMPIRVETLAAQVSLQEQKEMDGQQRYQNRLVEKEDLIKKLGMRTDGHSSSGNHFANPTRTKQPLY